MPMEFFFFSLMVNRNIKTGGNYHTELDVLIHPLSPEMGIFQVL